MQQQDRSGRSSRPLMQVPPGSVASNQLNLRKSVAWSSGRQSNAEATLALSGRLDELLVFELRQDGGTQYLHLSVRGLYKYCMNVITDRKEYQKYKEALNEEEDAPATEESSSPGAAPSAAEPSQQTTTPPAPSTEEAGSRVSFQSGADEQSSPVARPKQSRSRSGSVRASYTAYSPPDDTDEKQDVTYRERLGAYLHPRDMRRLVTPFSASNEPELIVRRHVMLLNFDPLRAIILRDRLLVLVPDGADSLLVTLEKRVRGGATEVENSVFGGGRLDTGMDMDTSTQPQPLDTSKSGEGLVKKLIKRSGEILTRHSFHGSDHSGTAAGKNTPAADIFETETTMASEGDDMSEDEKEWREMEAKDWIDLPFELQCLDAVLHVVCAILTEDTSDVEDKAQLYIQHALGAGGLDDDPLTIIRAVKDGVQEMRSRVKGFVQSISRVLDEDADMSLMNLSRLITAPERFIQPVPPEVLEEESDEPELILEAHLLIGFSLMNALNLVQGQVDTASELLDQKLDAIRNNILYANMMLTVASLCVATASLVGSIFGMNLVIPEELAEDPDAFVQTVVGTVVGAFVLGIIIVLLLVCSGTIPRKLRCGKHLEI